MKHLPLMLLLLLRFQGTIGITITNTLNNSSPLVGESITLSCNIADGKAGIVSWWKDKDVSQRATYVSYDCSVVPKYKSRFRNVRCDMNNYDFQLSNVQISDSGSWVCEADGQEAKTMLRLDVLVKPQTSLIGVKRSHDIVTVAWKQVTGKYTTLKIRYCQTGTETCWNYTVPNQDDNIATFYIDADKTYYFYMIIEDGGKVVYRSPAFTTQSEPNTTAQIKVDSTAQSEDDDSTDTVLAVVCSLVGAGVLAITSIIVAVVLWKRRLVRGGNSKKQSHRPANDTVDYDDTRISENQRPANDTVEYYNETWVRLTTVKRGSVQTNDNIGTKGVNDAFYPAEGTPDHKPPQPMVMRHHASVHGVLGNEPACPNDDVNAYDYVDSPGTWQQSVSGENPAPELQENQTEDATAFKRPPSRSDEDKHDKAHNEESQYTPLGPVEPVKQGEYLYLRELSQK